jgi:serine/threonine protein kinase/tetratricopeptide (TPR) repeat protein
VKPADPERLRRVNALLEAALALAPDEREAWLGALPEADRALVSTLRALLARASDDDDGFMHRPPVFGLDALDAGETELAGDRIGPYRLVRELGSGGMATVWLAERVDGALQRQVALKLPHSGWALGLARRMARERDILATLEHPHIARLYDAGVTEAGRPWLAMESVAGEPIDVHCRAHELDVPARLRLFLQVADAVAYAHARLVVHRDLKPSNILVRTDGSVMLLDFGVAKLLDDDTAPPAPDLTQQIGRAVTPDYAAPEQVLGRSVTVATDVYSLGVVLYELLAGQRPYRIGRVSAAALEEAILAAGVPPASSVVDDRRLARQLRGDLDNVLAKALRKDAARRYPSVESMAADVQRHLAGEPVLAERRSRWYRVGKFIRRHRLPIGAASAAALALVVGAGVALWQAREAARERDVAEALLARNEAVNEFLTMLLTDGVPPPQAGTIRQMLERGEALADAAFGRVPEHHAAILRLLAGYWDDPERSDPLLARAAGVLSDSSDRALRALVDCGRGQTLESIGRAGDAAALLERWIADPTTPELAAIECLKLRGSLAHGQSDAAGALRWSEQALQRLRALPRPSPPQEAELVGDVAFALYLNGRTQEAMQRFDESQARFVTAGRAESAAARVVLSNRGVAESASGDARGALQRYDALLAMHARLVPGQPAPSWVLGNRAAVLDKLGRLAEAHDAYEATSLASLQMTHLPGRVYGLVGMAGVRAQRGEHAEAARLLAEAEAEAAGKVPPTHPARIRAVLVQSQLDVAGGRTGVAVERLSALLEGASGAGDAAPARALLLRQRAEALLAAGRLAAARADAEAAVPVFDRLRGDRPHSCDLALAWLMLARVYAASSDPRARALAGRAAESLRATVDAASPDLRQAEALVARLGR